MRLLFLALLLVSASAGAQTSDSTSAVRGDSLHNALPDSLREQLDAAVREYARVTPWARIPPAQFPECDALRLNESAAIDRVGAAEEALRQGPPLPSLDGFDIDPAAPLYGTVDLGRPLRVGLGAGTVSPVRFVRRTDNELTVEATFSGGGSAYRVYVDPRDAGYATASRAYRDAYNLLTQGPGRASLGVTAARSETASCERTALFEWRKQRATEGGYHLTRTLARTPLYESEASYSPTAYVEAGEEVYVAQTGESRFFVYREDDSFLADDEPGGWVSASSVEGPDEVRAAMRPVMEEMERRAEREERALMASSPPVLITDFRAVGGDYTSGFRLYFNNMRAGKRIDYLRVTVQPYNRVGDPLTARYRGGQETVTAVGPIEASAYDGATVEFDDVWFTDMVSCVRLVSLRAEYSDGTTRTWRGGQLNALFGERGRWDNCSDL